jgi:hypothetical protein
LPSSIQVVPPSARLPWKVALPPIVWFHGSQSSITATGSSGLRVRAIFPMAMLAHIISWVLITALGMPVLPEVNRNLPTVAGSIMSIERATAAVGLVAASSLHGSDCIRGGGLVDMDQQHALEIEGGQRAGVDLAVLHENQAGLDQVEDIFELGVSWLITE